MSSPKAPTRFDCAQIVGDRLDPILPAMPHRPRWWSSLDGKPVREIAQRRHGIGFSRAIPKPSMPSPVSISPPRSIASIARPEPTHAVRPPEADPSIPTTTTNNASTLEGTAPACRCSLVRKKMRWRRVRRCRRCSTYGGFEIGLTPTFGHPHGFEAGGAFCDGWNLRGGGEYGKAPARRRAARNKQNVFDDFHRCRRIPDRRGRDPQGRLLAAGRIERRSADRAVVNQRPDLFVWRR